MTDQLIEIRERLLNIQPVSIFAESILLGIETDFNGPIDMIRDQANQSKETRKLVSDIISEETLLLIENL
jgi:hypothetical protein